MKQQNCNAVFENGVLRPIGNLQLAEGESVKLIVESHSIPKTKGFPEKGLIAQLTAHPIKIEDFQPLTKESGEHLVCIFISRLKSAR